MHKYYCQKHTYDYDTVIQFNFNDAIALCGLATKNLASFCVTTVYKHCSIESEVWFQNIYMFIRLKGLCF